MELITAGVFARESGLTRKALRVYERHDVLLPAAVDAWTGYRYYAREQLGTARLVVRLRRIDMPLSRPTTSRWWSPTSSRHDRFEMGVVAGRKTVTPISERSSALVLRARTPGYR